MSQLVHWSVTFVTALCAIRGTIGGVALSDSDYYTAGVVEFRPTLGGLSSSDLLAEHLHAYLEIIRSAEANETDILVFPEGTLNNAFQLTYVPVDGPHDTPCLDSGGLSADFLKRLSCAARDTGKYLLINLTEKSNCTDDNNVDPRPCSADGLNVYNTNVVFNREGRIISRYRKWNIYVEAKNTTPEVEYGIFDTDFGVRFGHFVCFDMLFYQPAEELVQRHGIRDIIFTSMFYSELPFLTAVQLQQSWSWGNNVNLLAAGSSYPLVGMTGSGIYAGNRGELITEMATKEGVRKLLVSRVPKITTRGKKASVSKQFPEFSKSSEPFSIRRDDIGLLRDPQLDAFKTIALHTSSIAGPVAIEEYLCDGDFCCSFDGTISPVNFNTSTTFYNYRLGVFNGSRSYQKDQLSYVQICSVYACLNSSAASCGLLFDDLVDLEENFIFSAMSIKGNFQKMDKLLIMPTTLTDQLKSLNDDAIEWSLTEERSSYHARIKLKQPSKNLLTFGIYANYYDRSSDSTPVQVIGKPLILINLIVIILNYFKSNIL